MTSCALWIVAFAIAANAAKSTSYETDSETENRSFSTSFAYSTSSSKSEHHISDSNWFNNQQGLQRNEQKLSSYQQNRAQQYSSKSNTREINKYKEFEQEYTQKNTESKISSHSFTNVDWSRRKKKNTNNIIEFGSHADNSKHSRVKFLVHKQRKHYSEESKSKESTATSSSYSSSNKAAARGSKTKTVTKSDNNNQYWKPHINIIKIKHKPKPGHGVNHHFSVDNQSHRKSAKSTNISKKNTKQIVVKTIKKETSHFISENSDDDEDYYCDEHKEYQKAKSKKKLAHQPKLNEIITKLPVPVVIHTGVPDKKPDASKEHRVNGVTQTNKTSVKTHSDDLDESEEEYYCDETDDTINKQNKEEDYFCDDHKPKTGNTITNPFVPVRKQESSSTLTSQSNIKRNKKQKQTSKIVKKKIIIKEESEDYYCDKHTTREINDHKIYTSKNTQSKQREKIYEVAERSNYQRRNVTKHTQGPGQTPNVFVDNIKNRFEIHKNEANSETENDECEESEDDYYCDEHRDEYIKENKSKQKQSVKSNETKNHVIISNDQKVVVSNEGSKHKINATNKNEDDFNYYCDKHKALRNIQINKQSNKKKQVQKTIKKITKIITKEISDDYYSHRYGTQHKLIGNKNTNYGKHSTPKPVKQTLPKIDDQTDQSEKSETKKDEESDYDYYCDEHADYFERKDKSVNNTKQGHEVPKPNLDKDHTKTDNAIKETNKTSVNSYKAQRLQEEEDEEYTDSEESDDEYYCDKHKPAISHTKPHIPKPTPTNTEEKKYKDKRTNQKVKSSVTKKYTKYKEDYYCDKHLQQKLQEQYKSKSVSVQKHARTQEERKRSRKKLEKEAELEIQYKLRTLYNNDGSGRCYCTCEVGQKPIFFSVPKEKLL